MKDVTVSLDQAIALLNEALGEDQVAIRELIIHKVPCNQNILNHPTIQTAATDMAVSTGTVGMLGILNGIFGTIKGGDLDGYGYICAMFDDKTNELIRFGRSDEETIRKVIKGDEA